MKSNFLLSFFRALKLPLKLLVSWLGKKPKKVKSELERKQEAYVKNFAPRHYGKQNFKKLSQKKKRKTNKKFYLVKSIRIIQ